MFQYAPSNRLQIRSVYDYLFPPILDAQCHVLYLFCMCSPIICIPQCRDLYLARMSRNRFPCKGFVKKSANIKRCWTITYLNKMFLYPVLLLYMMRSFST